MEKIKLAIVGIGNSANSLIQGLSFYKDIDEGSSRNIGLIQNSIGGYLIKDIEIVAAYDVNANKIGVDVSDAIWISPNNSRKFADVKKSGVHVMPGALFDGIAPHMMSDFPIKENPNSFIDSLIESKAEICVSYLPVGSKLATEFYANACIKANVAFINGIPEFIASDPLWIKRFEEARIPCAGDDIQSQVGATALHRLLVSFIRERGQTVLQSYQLDIGGNSDFNNLTDSNRITSKKISKTYPVIKESCTEDIKVVPADYIPFLHDNKIAYINIKGEQFGKLPFEIELKLSVEDSPNNAGVMIDAIRNMKLSLDRKLYGYQNWSAYYFKHPLKLVSLQEAKKIVDNFIMNKQ